MHKPLCRADGAFGEIVPAVGPMREFEPLADAAEDDCVLAYDIASAYRLEND